jgi:hypothetical protein
MSKKKRRDVLFVTATSCRFDWTGVGPMTGASTKQAEVLVDLTLPFLLGQLAFGIKFAREIHT